MDKLKKGCNALKKITKLFVALSLMVTLTLPYLSSEAETVSNEAVLQLTREEAKEILINDSNVLRSLYWTRDSLLSQYSELNDQIDGLKTLYNLLPKYRQLYDKNQEVENNEELKEYAELLLAQPTLEARLSEIEAELLAIGDTVDPDLLAEKAILEAEKQTIQESLNRLSTLDGQLTDEEKESLLTVEEIYELNIYETQFLMIGIDSPRLSKSTEYTTFIEPIYIMTNDFSTSIRSLELTIANTEATLVYGLDQLYTSLLTLEEINQLLEESYELKKTELAFTEKQFELGKASADDVEKAKNEMEMAQLEKNKMMRQIDSLEMNFKQMLGIENETDIVLEDRLDLIHLQSRESYIESALENRNELGAIKNSRDAKEYEMGYIEDYFRESSYEYKIVEGELNSLELELLQNERVVEKEMMGAYSDVLLKKQAYANAVQALNQAEDRYKELEKYVVLGFATQHNLDNLRLLVIQNENAKISAYREYAHAVQSLESASGIGPAYSSSEGGMTVE